MPLAAVAIGAFFALVVLPRATMPMADGDAWWHIHAGEEILSTGRIPDTNTWTIAGDGFPWTSQDWLSNIVMAGLFNAGEWGVAWLSLAFGLVVVAALALLWRAIGLRRSSGWAGRLLFLTAGLIAAGPIVGIRVQTIDLLMTAATVLVVWWHLADPRPWRPFLLVFVALVWVNLHAGWVMLFLLGGAVVVGEFLDRWLSRDLSRPPLSGGAVGWLVLALAASAAVLVVNPNGLAIYAYPWETASIAAHRDFLVEWSPPSPLSFEGQVTIAFLALVVAPTVIFAWRRMPATDLLWLTGLTILTIGAVRFALFLGPIAAALAAIHLAPILRATPAGRAVAGIAARWERPPRSARLRAVNTMLLITVVAAGVGLAVARAAPATQAPEIAAAVPIGAADWVGVNAPEARILNTYSWGGYLSRRLPDAKAYIDGRSDIYGDAPIRRFAETWNVSTDPAGLLDGEAIDLVLIRPNAPLAAWLDEAPAWVRAYEDGQAAIWVRSGGG